MTLITSANCVSSVAWNGINEAACTAICPANSRVVSGGCYANVDGGTSMDQTLSRKSGNGWYCTVSAGTGPIGGVQTVVGEAYCLPSP